MSATMREFNDVNGLFDFFLTRNQSVIHLKLTLVTGSIPYVSREKLNKLNPSDMPPLFYGTSPIKRVNEVKYLGIYMDEQLNFNRHIEKLRGKISPMVGMLYKLKFYLPSRILKSIYHAFIHSNIQYLLIVWGSAHKASLKPIQISHNRALKSVFNKGPLFGTVELYHTVAKGILPVLPVPGIVFCLQGDERYGS
jgi:hypothetical protein